MDYITKINELESRIARLETLLTKTSKLKAEVDNTYDLSSFDKLTIELVPNALDIGWKNPCYRLMIEDDVYYQAVTVVTKDRIQDLVDRKANPMLTTDKLGRKWFR